MNKYKYGKRIVICIVLVVIVGTYMSAFVNKYNNTRKTEVKYFDLNEKVVYGGVEYSFDSDLYTMDRLIDTFGLQTKKEELKKINDEISGAYIVTKVHARRVNECKEAGKYTGNCVVLNKYMDASGTYYEILDLIQKENHVGINELKVGEETEYYMLNILSEKDYCESVWEHLSDAAFYIEFHDYETNEFLTRVEIIEGKYGKY